MIEDLQAIGRADPDIITGYRTLVVGWLRVAVKAVWLPLGITAMTVPMLLVTGVIVVRYLLTREIRGGPFWLSVGMLALLVVLTLAFAFAFARVLALPRRVENLSDEFCDALRRYQSSDILVDPDPKRRGLRQRVRLLMQCGRLTFNIYRIIKREMDVRADWTIHAGIAMMSPIFWIVWVVTLALAGLTAGVLLGGCLVHHLMM